MLKADGGKFTFSKWEKMLKVERDNVEGRWGENVAT